MSVTLLAIESSCDETAAAVIQDGNILSNIVASQQIHEKYGGIVPELASRAHQQNIIPVVSQALPARCAPCESPAGETMPVRQVRRRSAPAARPGKTSAGGKEGTWGRKTD